MTHDPKCHPNQNALSDALNDRKQYIGCFSVAQWREQDRQQRQAARWELTGLGLALVTCITSALASVAGGVWLVVLLAG